MADEQNYQNPSSNPTAGGYDPNADFDPNAGASGFAPQPTPTSEAGGEQEFAYFDPNQQAGGVDPNATNMDFSGDAQFNYGEVPQTPGFDPNAGYDPNGYGAGNYAQTPGADSYAAGGFDPNQAGGVDPAFAQNGFDQNPSAQPDLNQVNTFEEKKTGNKLFLIGAIVLVPLLLGLVGFLVVSNLNNNDTVDTTTDSLETPVGGDVGEDLTTTPSEPEPVDEGNESGAAVDESLTGGPNSFATRARRFNATSTPNEWNLRKFFVPSIDDETGECLNVSVCGPNADPDRDGLNNINEYNFDTDPLSGDSDRDSIADGDELYIYYTDPNEDDTDVDTFTDGQEIAGCYNPARNGVGGKYTATELAELERNTSLLALHEPTVSLLRGAGATTEDIAQNGTVTATCDVEASAAESAPAETEETPADEAAGGDASTIAPI